MIKKIHFFTFLLLFLVSNVFSQTVFVTKSGKKFHSENCKYLSKSSSSIKLSEAKNNGYEPCSVCKPENNKSESGQNKIESKVEVESESNTESDKPVNFSPSNNKLESVQCSATTKSGKRCSRTTTNSNSKCWQHQG